MDSRYFEESKIRPTGNISSLAAKFPDMDTAERVYTKLHTAMLAHNLDITVNRSRIRDVWHVIVLADENHIAHVEQEAKQILTD